MKRRALIAISFLSIVLLAGIIFWHPSPPDPVYKGKHFSEWADQLEFAGSMAKAREPEEAIRHIGTNAYPYMLKMLATKDSWLKKLAIKLTDKQYLIRIRWRREFYVHEMAVVLFAEVGPAAKPAVPGLIELLRNRDSTVRWYSLDVLTGIGPGASNAVPEVIRLVGDKDQRVVEKAREALRSINRQTITATSR